MASDLADLGKYRIKFDLGTPFKPYGQLMGVLPAASAHALPPAYRNLMSSPDSPIIDFYPTDFRLDLNGKKFQWQAVTLLPFCDQKRLLAAIDPLWDTLTDDQKRMNSFGTSQVYVNAHHPMARTMIALNAAGKDQSPQEQKKNKQLINVQESQGMGGYIQSYGDVKIPGDDVKSYTGKNPTVKNCQVISAVYELPDFKPHVTCLLPGAEPYEPVLTAKDFDLMRNGKRFGKPRQKRGRRNDSHSNHNRSWGHQRGYQEGNYRAVKRSRRDDEHQPRRMDYQRNQPQPRRMDYQRNQPQPQQMQGQSARKSFFITGQPRDVSLQNDFSSPRKVPSSQQSPWRSSNASPNRSYETRSQNNNWGYVHPPSRYENHPNFNQGASGGNWPSHNHQGRNNRKRRRG